MNGKGDKWRKGVDFKKYWDNFPIPPNKKQSTAIKIEKKKHGKVRYNYKRTTQPQKMSGFYAF